MYDDCKELSEVIDRRGFIDRRSIVNGESTIKIK